ncbi:hypothetical protein DENSPDRAFT_584268 [Dentipellis sp. KUC8613]|nr:hypothetical protein DENSPDRAFT_584268 [Dentipellis sp. KUC8613]
MAAGHWIGCRSLANAVISVESSVCRCAELIDRLCGPPRNPAAVCLVALAYFTYPHPARLLFSLSSIAPLAPPCAPPRISDVAIAPTLLPPSVSAPCPSPSSPPTKSTPSPRSASPTMHPQTRSSSPTRSWCVASPPGASARTPARQNADLPARTRRRSDGTPTGTCTTKTPPRRNSSRCVVRRACLDLHTHDPSEHHHGPHRSTMHTAR